MARLSGHCLCGSVRFTISGAVRGALHCHCQACRRATSSPLTTFVTVARSDAEISGDSYRLYASSPGVSRGFCGTCGSPMSYVSDQRPDEIDFYVASLDDASSIIIREHGYWGERVSWLNVVDDLPKNEA
ncbi:GFA family protein [Rhizobium sp. RU36D]|uniref:GFA family protein n=1 Tax=Rhizobium sp. RU36D TaxID=1907415 RepID=UPI0009D7C3A9|nr:GFA family protein [Rhizobium sp. RU36D]SMC82083.1 Uncharacterized conserved protein [Rhizobium sp. RU36D]